VDTKTSLYVHKGEVNHRMYTVQQVVQGGGKDMTLCIHNIWMGPY